MSGGNPIIKTVRISPSPSIASTKAELERYLHYYSRYEIHAESQAKENELRDRTEAKVTELMDLSTGASEPAAPAVRSTSSQKVAGKTAVAQAGAQRISPLAPQPNVSLETAASIAATPASSGPAAALTRIDLQYLLDAAEALIRCRRTLKNTYPFAYYMRDGQAKTLFEHLQAELDETTEKLSGLLEDERGADRMPLVLCTASALQRLSHFTEWVEQGMTSEETVGSEQGGTSEPPLMQAKRASGSEQASSSG